MDVAALPLGGTRWEMYANQWCLLASFGDDPPSKCRFPQTQTSHSFAARISSSLRFQSTF